MLALRSLSKISNTSRKRSVTNIVPPNPAQTWKSLFPLTTARVVGTLAKTYCLASIDAAFYPTARGLLLPFTMLLSLAWLRPKPYFPPLSLAGASAITLGFAAGMTADVRSKLSSGRALALGVGSSATTAAESVVVKRYVGSGESGSSSSSSAWQLAWMSSVGAVALLAPLLLVSGEADTLAAILRTLSHPAEPFAVNDGPAFLRLALLAGFVGFLLAVATFAQIELTSPTTHVVVGAVRGVVQSALAVAVLREPAASGRGLSVALIIGGSALYGWARDRFAHGQEAGPASSQRANATVSQDAFERQKLHDEERAQRDAGDAKTVR